MDLFIYLFFRNKIRFHDIHKLNLSHYNFQLSPCVFNVHLFFHAEIILEK